MRPAALPIDEALAVADSALRSRDLAIADLRTAAGQVKGAGAARVRRVLLAADGRAANPFESVLRAVASEIDGLHLVPQLQVAEPGLFAVVDIGDRDRKLALEAEGIEFHGTKEGFQRDVRRHTELGMYGWHSLRFVWSDVMYKPAWVRWVIETWLATEDGMPLPDMPPGAPIIRDRAA